VSSVVHDAAASRLSAALGHSQLASWQFVGASTSWQSSDVVHALLNPLGSGGVGLPVLPSPFVGSPPSFAVVPSLAGAAASRLGVALSSESQAHRTADAPKRIAPTTMKAWEARSMRRG
jgi:hypothetical protein